ncbi:MAG: DUF2493 domain-containing protein [Planctomycetes bacterium]|nr:DUF2493 domain-containing protein [Planctomycetota bacterium]
MSGFLPGVGREGAGRAAMENRMKILVTGGRDFGDRNLLFSGLDRIHAENPITMIIHGGAKGADALASEWAASRGVPVEVFKPNWRLGRHAGLQRNNDMLASKPELVVAAPGGKGTADMVAKAKKASLKVVKLVE